MTIYCRGYYGYKNLGDELLLFGVLQRIVDAFPECTHIDVEAGDPERLQVRLDKHSHYLPQSTQSVIVGSVPRSFFALGYDHVVIGGGEVLSDARPFPYNGGVHVVRFRKHILCGTYSLVGGVGTRKYRHSRPVFKILLSRASHVQVREQHSFENTAEYRSQSKTVLSTDFALQFFEQYRIIESAIASSRRLPPLPQGPGFIINTNPYLWNSEVRSTITAAYSATKRNTPGIIPYFVPAEIGSDDGAYEALLEDIPELTYYNRTDHTVDEIVQFLSTMKSGVATRLHMMLLLHELGVDYLPLVYQEKITHLLGHTN